MSAWLVSQTHVRALVTAASELRNHQFVHNLGLSEDLNELGKEIWRENIRSLRARYGDDPDDAWDPAPEGFSFAEVHVSDFELVKACHCFDYQACETDDYHETPVAKLVKEIKRCALGRLALTDDECSVTLAYDDAPWGIDDPEAVEPEEVEPEEVEPEPEPIKRVKAAPLLKLPEMIRLANAEAREDTGESFYL